MPSTKPRMTKTLFLALLSVLVIATGLITSCNKQSPGPGPTPEMAPEGETIIIIKGGSVEVGFDETKYVNDKPNHYECSNCKFVGIEVGADEYNLTPCELKEQTSNIHIKAGTGAKDFSIKGKAGKGIEIELNNTEYPLNASTKKHYNAGNKLDDVKVTPASLCTCPDTGDGKCYIRIRSTP